MEKSYVVIVKGRVQGVGFRFGAASKAAELGIVGLVKNLDDGSVYIEAEGQEEQLESFLAWCRKGPWWAKVASVDISEQPLKHYTSFIVA